VPNHLEQAVTVIIDAAFHLHVGLGPGLMESIYEEVLFRDLTRKGLEVRRQPVFSFEYEGLRFENAVRLDLLVEGMIVVEPKSVARLDRVHRKQILTYLRLLHFPIGLLFNFGAPTFKEGVHRLVHNYNPSAASRLRASVPA
jgi:iron complex transport system substrate-binding protein